jgi:enhancer of mRNA-decapping protein 3
LFAIGKIVNAEPDRITITKAFHNGIKVKKENAEFSLGKTEIESLEFIALVDPAVAASRSVENTPAPIVQQSNVKVEAKSPTNFTSKPVKQSQQPKTSKPIPMRKTPQNLPPQNNTKDTRSRKMQSLKGKQQNMKNSYLMQPDEFSNDEEFDFESNLKLFDKKEIFKEIEGKSANGESNNKPDIVRQTEEKYRCDENVLDSLMMKFRNVELEFKPKQEYTTTESGIIIPSIPQSLRNRIQNLAHDHGHTMERQNDFLARGATELAMQLLGGSRRLCPQNQHQWPRVTIICDEPYNFRQSEVGLSTARQLASHGLKVMVYVKLSSSSDKSSKELELFTATGNDITSNVKDLFVSDLVILSVRHMNQNSQIVRYINDNRAQVMAIDPPATGIAEINLRNAVIPILPLDDINNTCGQLHLVNLCLSEKFYKDAGVKYSPIFGSRFIIPLHLNK